ncbi:pyrroline-5-carboxylate reductase [bacterium]|nr:pyrroline-5-carboxylate reductase [bacterium]
MPAPGSYERIALIGAGRMGTAMLRGWLSAASGSEFDVIEPDPSGDLVELAARGRIRLNPPSKAADLVMIAIKPQAFRAAADQIRGWTAPTTTVVSIMAGMTIAPISDALHASAVVRAMPNTPGAIGAGVTAFAVSTGFPDGDVSRVAAVLSPLGDVVGPLAEAQIDAVTALSGSGPAYVFLLAEAMEKAGVELGLAPETARRLAYATVGGAGQMLRGDQADAGAFREAVTSPGGTTRAALDVLQKDQAFEAMVRSAMAAAAARSKSLASG